MPSQVGAAAVVPEDHAQTPRELFLIQQLTRARQEARAAALALVAGCDSPEGLEALSDLAMTASLEAAELRAAIRAVRLSARS